MLVETDSDGCFVRVRGNPEHPYSHGSLCGKTAIFGPWGTLLGCAREGDDVVVCELDFADQDRVRSALPCLGHRRL